ncbi:MAG: hypothetical protein AUI33_06990 [Ignavibacteria bacterium 13_1_40CM_2_61_4]|nr:MAG: hypothetical protein AUI33_06990 [Ignavibacteria bacterium 13_1_40CM_2_61_4]
MLSEKRRSVFLKGLLLLMGLSAACLAEIHAGTARVSQRGPSGSTAGGLFIPAGLAPATSGPTKSDGIYVPNTNREIYQKISTDYQEIVALTNQVNEGKPLPAADILLLYEAGKHTRIGVASRSLRVWAREAERSEDFPEAVAFYKSATFLDDPLMDAIAGARTASGYTPGQRRRAIQRGVERIVYHWSRHYIQRGTAELNAGFIDEAWAIYVGEEKEERYPNSVAATAQSMEAHFKRSGSLDEPLRRAMSQAQKAAADKNAAACTAAANDIYSRFHAIFYLGAAYYLNEALKATAEGNLENAKAALVEGFALYQSIQPQVAKADPGADKIIVGYYKSDPSHLSAALRDSALAALNRTASALLLKQNDLVTSANF